MDPYLQAIGFNKRGLNFLKRNEMLRELKREILENPDKRRIYGFGEDFVNLEYEKMFDKNLGIILRGRMDDDERVTVDEIEAIAFSDFDSVSNNFLVEFSKGEPVIVFEEEETGNELVFSLQNRIDFYKDERYFIDYGRSVNFSRKEGIIKRKVNFAALSTYGTVVLPVEKDEEFIEERKNEESYYRGLVFKFKEGDTEAGEILRYYAEETSDIIRQRLLEEDFLSVVEGYFMPVDDGDADYSILGDITDIDEIENSFTHEKVYKLTLNITGTEVQLFINKKAIQGLPIKGMRFMGNCRLKGHVRI